MKKILIIDTTNSENILLRFQYVNPITKIIDFLNEENKIDIKYEIIELEKYRKKKLNDYDKIILSGTSLKDFKYLSYRIKENEPLKKYEKPVLGICAGAQILANMLNLSLERKKIIDFLEGTKKARDPILKNIKKTEKYYLLTSYIIEPNKNIKNLIIAEKYNISILMKYKNYYLSIFHPEVRNENILINFLLL